ncbi:MAG: TIGR04255 family protein [Armatimonadetes bacterium]|nr:TIGR04255 family protein [Armatimonadota bacterium]NCQ26466.1 TIGR04255 family protein [Armatimonadota bacterium]PIU95276.1 MAG: hypothetical protein COS65_03235 [Armatimonadetes bacterium CG06_land_8_20_14_3_00_66_21]PIX37028.1 MAG: hypothetical protein COZ57_36420 [Armatimonadetes bacterium CG_4_8_14_3_um_filter_66_20]
MVEVRWALAPGPPGQQTDPHYKLLLARLFDRASGHYPEHVQLPTASIPDEFVGHVVQHQFRVGSGQWPLIQLGPGIMTLNSTEDYLWEDFQPRAVSAVEMLYQAHPKPTELKVANLILRYIDAVEFDYRAEDTFAFLRDMLQVDVSLPGNLFETVKVGQRPLHFNWQSSFACDSPKGAVHLNFATGQKSDTPAVIWETTVQSAASDVPALPGTFADWIGSAHTITDDWFFKLIEGELEGRFSGE